MREKIFLTLVFFSITVPLLGQTSTSDFFEGVINYKQMVSGSGGEDASTENAADVSLINLVLYKEITSVMWKPLSK